MMVEIQQNLLRRDAKKSGNKKITESVIDSVIFRMCRYVLWFSRTDNG